MLWGQTQKAAENLNLVSHIHRNHFHRCFFLSCFWTLDVSRTASYEISLICVCLSICLSICLSLSFLKIGSLVFSDIVHDDSWPWYLVTDRIWAKWAKVRPKTRFFAIFSSLVYKVFLEIACNDSLQQCITSGRVKPHKKVFGDQIWSEAGQNRAWN